MIVHKSWCSNSEFRLCWRHVLLKIKKKGLKKP